MRPHEPKPRKRAAERAARAYLRHALGWLEGYPLAQSPERVRWRAFGTLERGGPPVDLDVDRERLRSSTYALRGARRKFPRALPRVVGDVDAWVAGVERRLALLKAAVHDGAPLPTDLDAALRWALGDAPEHAPEARRRLARWKPALAVVAARGVDARELALEVALRPGPAETLEPFRRLLGDPRAWTVPLEDGGFVEQLARGLRDAGPPGTDGLAPFLTDGLPRPAARLGPTLLAEVLRRPSETELRALGATLSPTRLAEWDAWWRDAGAVERDLRSALTRARLHDHGGAHGVDRAFDESRERLEGLAAPPAAWDLERARGNAARFAARCDPKLAPLVLDAWEAVPDGPAVARPRHRGLTSRAVVAERWTRALLQGLAPKPAHEIARAQLALLRERGRDAPDLVARAFTGVVLDDDANALGGDPAQLAALSATLGEVARRGAAGAELLLEIEDWDVEVLPFLAETRDPARAADMLRAWKIADGEDGWPDERLLARLCGEDVLDAAFWRAGGKLDWDPAEEQSLLRAAANERARALFRELLKDGEARRLREFAGLHRAAAALAAAEDAIDEPPLAPTHPTASTHDLEWVPPALRAAARELEVRAGAAALDRALRDVARRPAHLAAEEEALEARVRAAATDDAPHLRARLAALRRRRLDPPPPSPAQVARGGAQLRRRLRAARLAAWERRLEGILDRRLPARLPRLRERVPGPTLAALAVLRPRVRDLAWRLLAGEDLGADPANGAWRRRMEARGLDLAPWLDPAPRPEVVTPKGRRLRFAFEADPLEILHMGRWFGTCLSPGEMNFFSTVANGADANKRVLVARDPRGTAQVRCLLAITRGAELLAFHVYAHEEGAWARDRVHAIAAELARAMRTRLVPRGTVETLVASSWYDDGPVDLTGRLGEFGSGGPLVDAIRGADPADLPRLLEEGLGAELLDGAIDQIVTHEVFAEDPARLVALGAWLHERPLSLWAATEVARRVVAVDPDLARTVLRRFLRRRRGRRLAEFDDGLVRLAGTLVACDEPGLALRVLRRTEYERADAEHVAVEALLRLHRPSQAAERLRALARSGDAVARRRLEALEARAEPPR